MSGAALVAELAERARRLGFDAFGVTRADARPDLPDKLGTALAAGWHAGMAWMAETRDRRADPRALWPEARSAIVLGLSYAPERSPLDDLERRSQGLISAYARNRDYHDLIKGRLKELAGLITRTGADAKVFVDTAPVMEKPLAEAAGLGWQGKHSVLISRDFGSWLFLGVILTTAELPPDAPHAERCGSCRRCLDICPTDAFPAPFRLDARRCLAYYSVEHEGPIPLAFRAPMGNRIFGCDDCLAVCPWNRFAGTARELRFHARVDNDLPPLADLLELDEPEFRARFAGSPVKRLGHARFLRNVLIATGNSGDAGLLSATERHLAAPDPMVRGAAIWAVRRLAPARGRELALALAPKERDMEVAAEWTAEVADA